MDHIFSVIDVDGDGNISATELFNCLDRLGQGVTFDDVQNIMAEVDEVRGSFAGLSGPFLPSSQALHPPVPPSARRTMRGGVSVVSAKCESGMLSLGARLRVQSLLLCHTRFTTSQDGSGGVDKEEFTELIRKNADYI